MNRVLGKISELVKRMAADETERPVQVFIPKDGGLALDSEKTYFRLTIEEMFLTKSREWFKTVYPSVQASVQLNFGGRRGAKITRVVKPPEKVTQEGALKGYTIMSTTPFNGGTVEIETALLAMEGTNYLGSALDVLQDFSGLVGPPLAQALTVAEKISNGMDSLLDATGGDVHLPYHDSFQGVGQGKELHEGYLAIVKATSDEVDKERFSVVGSELYYHKEGEAEATQFRDHDYILLRIDVMDKRDDYRKLKSIEEAWHRYLDAFDEYDENTMKAARRALRSAIRRSPDLAEYDKSRVWLDYKQEIAELEEDEQGLGAASYERTLDDIVDTWATPMDDAVAMGRLREDGVEDERIYDEALICALPGNGGGGNGTGDTEKTVRTYPDLGKEDYAYLGKPYVLTIKLSDDPQETTGGDISAPPIDIPFEPGEITRKIQVSIYAKDFDLAEGESDTQELTFYIESAASNAVTFTLFAQKDPLKEKYFSDIHARFYAGVNLIGTAIRRVEILSNETIDKTPVDDFPKLPGIRVDEEDLVTIERKPTPLSLDPQICDDKSIHLTVLIEEDGDDLNWTIHSSYLPEKPPAIGISENVLKKEKFVTSSLAPLVGVDYSDKNGDLNPVGYDVLESSLIALRKKIPQAFWDRYSEALDAHEQANQTPDSFAILFITSESFIPWELAPISEGELAPDELPLMLGSVHRVGRWLVGTGHKFLPDSSLDLTGIAVAAPTYQEKPLEKAQDELRFIENKYNPFVIDDTESAFREFVKEGAPTEGEGVGIFHFAGHGGYYPKAPSKGSFLSIKEGVRWSIHEARASRHNLGSKRATFAFFNACTAGQETEGILGNNGGWGAILLEKKYVGYVGPLWNVNDVYAKEASEMFYTLTLDDELPVGEAMRRIRCKFSKSNTAYSFLSYVYFGHPNAKIEYERFEQKMDRRYPNDDV